MFEEERLTPVTTADLRGWVARLGALASQVPDAERVEQLRLLEQVKNAACAAQARVAVAFEDSQREAQAAAGVPARERGRGIGAQVALARMESPHRGSRLLGLARLLVADLPRTLAGMRAGEVSEWRATLLARAVVVLDEADRRAVDAAVGPLLGGLSDRQVEARARAAAYGLDPAAAVSRGRTAMADRRVSVRPAPDVMALVTGFVPAAQGVAVLRALTQAADAARAAGDPCSRDQVKADTFVERLTGQATASGVPVEVGLVMTDRALLGGADDVASLEGYGPVPAAVARALLRSNGEHDHEPDHPNGGHPAGGDGGGQVEPPAVAAGPLGEGQSRAAGAARGWLRRLFTDPVDGSVALIDTRRRRFDGPVRALLVHRDQWCRTPWCGAPIREADHVVPYAAGGPTSLSNGQGLCQACNLARTAPGWSSIVGAELAGASSEVVTITPTGAAYRSKAPPALPGLTPWPPGAAPPGTRLYDVVDDEDGIDVATWLAARVGLRSEHVA
ncbi:MAG TPA: DUF222 domain-containing protein [Intrasporangium sp.]|uniref:HNH endonuclease n=1 Tax=Intrasporangium sp. TaxID=1925024 RepID=UPI002D78743C|nr:DUF222 domain-containing protein [Intrasporangium sp.]HET7398259.1 DUF222 domain-containing protein [Intrasporangium sp.]